jgi:hypothetical protein
LGQEGSTTNCGLAPEPGAFCARATDDHPLITRRAAASSTPPPEQSFLKESDFIISSRSSFYRLPPFRTAIRYRSRRRNIAVSDYVCKQYLLANQLRRGSEKHFHCRLLSTAWQTVPSVQLCAAIPPESYLPITQQNNSFCHDD